MDDQQNAPFTAHHLRFEVEAITPLLLSGYPGPAIRGALFGALRRHFCPASVPAAGPPTAEHKAICPVCWLMATEKPGGERGRDVPRPYTVEPPLPRDARNWRPQRIEPGERFAFGLTLFAQALHLFPYLVVAMPLMGQAGLGLRLAENSATGGRGQFALRRVRAINPLTGEIQAVLAEGQTMVQMPEAPATPRDVDAVTHSMLERLAPHGRVRFDFMTPARIIEAGRLVQHPWLGPLFRRLLERLDALRGEFAAQPPVAGRESLIALANQVRLVEDHTAWFEVRSGSRRLGRPTPVSGFVGSAIYGADLGTWEALLPHLLWGQVIHVGKNATKGNGWYEVRVEG